jgi:hypothetical protein
MIPAPIVRFLDRANVAHAGTRTRELVPHGHRVSGWTIGADGRTLTVLLPEMPADQLIASLEDNGQLALAVEEYPAHEAYQFKGRYIGHRRVGPADLEASARLRDRFVESLRRFQPPEAVPAMRAFTQVPAVAVDFEVLEIFVQTPGPGAGARLVPEP